MQVERTSHSCTFKEMSIGKLYHTFEYNMLTNTDFYYYFIKCKDSNKNMFGDRPYLVCLSDNTVTQEKDVNPDTLFYLGKNSFKLISE